MYFVTPVQPRLLSLASQFTLQAGIYHFKSSRDPRFREDGLGKGFLGLTMAINTVGRLLSRHLQDLKPGRLDWIGLRPERKVEMLVVDQVEAIAELGLAGDRRCQGSAGSARQVTLINQEHIDVIAKLLGLDAIDPAILRRNLVVSGINMVALRHQRFRIGDAEFEASAHCHPCLRMEQALGKGAVAAMLGHGGVCAKIIRGGVIRVGDEVVKLDNTED